MFNNHVAALDSTAPSSVRRAAERLDAAANACIAAVKAAPHVEYALGHLMFPFDWEGKSWEVHFDVRVERPEGEQFFWWNPRIVVSVDDMGALSVDVRDALGKESLPFEYLAHVASVAAELHATLVAAAPLFAEWFRLANGEEAKLVSDWEDGVYEAPVAEAAE